METRRVGSIEVSLVGLGTNNFGMRMDAAASEAVVRACLDNGITFFDTADVYGQTKSEEFLGLALAKHRDEAVIGTKFGAQGGASPSNVRTAVEDSLRRLGTDRIDLYQLHRVDPETPIADTLAALNECVEAGKVLEIGCSNFSAEQLDEAEAAVADGAARFVTVQNHFNLLNRGDEAEVLPACERLGISYIPYFPLASGMLTGKYRRGEDAPEGTRLAGMPADRRDRVMNDATYDTVEALTAWAQNHGHSVLELAIAWLAAKPTVVSVIAGATKSEQAVANAAAASWTLTPTEVSEVDALVAS